MPTDNEMSQFQALYTTKSEANSLLGRLKGSTFLTTRGIEVYTVSAEPMVMHDGSKQEAVFVMCRAETDRACGMGVGFVTAVADGIAK